MNYRTILYIGAFIVIIFGITALEFIATKSKSDYELLVDKYEDGWRYNIHYNDKLLIKQNYIPGIPNQKTFTSKREAERIGYLVINRLEMNDSPSITKADLDKNQIDY